MRSPGKPNFFGHDSLAFWIPAPMHSVQHVQLLIYFEAPANLKQKTKIISSSLDEKVVALKKLIGQTKKNAVCNYFLVL